MNSRRASPGTTEELNQINREVRELRARNPQPIHTAYSQIPLSPITTLLPPVINPNISQEKPMRFVLHNDRSSQIPLTSSVPFYQTQQNPASPHYYSTPVSPTLSSPNRSKYNIPQSNSKGILFIQHTHLLTEHHTT